MIERRWTVSLDALSGHIGRPVAEADLERAFRRLGGRVTIAASDGGCEVVWRPATGSGEPEETAITWLQAGDLDDALIVLETLLADDPEQTDLLYNIGMAHSDRRHLDRAAELLTHLVRIDPDHVNGEVALGVALLRRGDDAAARPHFERALALEPDNPYAQRNLGALLLRAGDAQAALEHLRRAANLSPRDAQAWYGVAQAAEAVGDTESADDAYETVIGLAGIGEIAESARQARTRIAQALFRERGGGGRPDAVMYCLDALQRFDRMTELEVGQVTMEIALLGRSGLDVNDPERKYELRSLPGRFSGLQLVSLMFVGMKQMQPGADVGFDLAAEYAQALTLHRGGDNGAKQTP